MNQPLLFVGGDGRRVTVCQSLYGWSLIPSSHIPQAYKVRVLQPQSRSVPPSFYTGYHADLSAASGR